MSPLPTDPTIPGQATQAPAQSARPGASPAPPPAPAPPAPPGKLWENLTPNWYASVMGTGIVPVAAVSLPGAPDWIWLPATFVWVLAAGWLAVLLGFQVRHIFGHPQAAAAHHLNPGMGHFYGAPAMALMVVGAGTLLIGQHAIGLSWALRIDTVLWLLGTAIGLVSAVAIPYFTFTRYEIPPQGAFGGWLMSIVPPMVSAATGAQLIAYAQGELQLLLALSCYAFFGISMFASLIIVTLIWSRLAHHDLGPAAMVPTLWIILGPLGQSVTATASLGHKAHLLIGNGIITPGVAEALQAASLFFGLPTIGFATLWAAIAGALTLRTLRRGLPFTLTWWSFTFPVGTVVTGYSWLATLTGSHTLAAAAWLWYTFLVLAWAIVALRTINARVRKLI